MIETILMYAFFVLMGQSALFLIFGIWAWINSQKLLSYLKKEEYEFWRGLTTIGNVGPGMRNSPKFFKFVYSKNFNENEKILRLKDNLKMSIRNFIVVLLSIGTNILFMIGVMFFSK
jgi:hypothetical protein